MADLTRHKVRGLTPADLAVALPPPVDAETLAPAPPEETDAPTSVEIADDDPILVRVKELLGIYGGVLFTGPPGTSKTYYAEQVALAIAGDPHRVRIVQFHPSYQYEDFMEGYVATDDGYQVRLKHFALICRDAREDPEAYHQYVLVIDELSRSDPGRVFGEALTYMERTKRGKKFRLASGTELSVPPNVHIVATMNPHDRGVDQVDAALGRRFAKYRMDPNASILDSFLRDQGMAELLRLQVLAFFEQANAAAKAGRNPHAVVGQTYFLNVKDIADLNRLWEHDLRFHFERAYQLDPDGLAAVRRAWDAALAEPEPGGAPPG
ncbi:MAG: 5-methylcytosine-specific restriction enzyme [Frankiaceae bacterium]|nr:5-methylcytosine-specific restriction enzyme [Frankiaceae bacterium]